MTARLCVVLQMAFAGAAVYFALNGARTAEFLTASAASLCFMLVAWLCFAAE